jgi:holo-[acyl-carrier protein] synthase
LDAVNVGVDVIEIERVRRALARPGFRERCFTPAEQEYCDSRRDPAQSYAARFAGKEAVGKALGCGTRFTWKEIEIVGRPKPSVRLSGRTAAFARRVHAGAIDLSMTHAREIAAATCVVVLHGDA